MKLRALFLLGGLLSLGAGFLAGTPQRQVSYSREIEPILKMKCGACHVKNSWEGRYAGSLDVSSLASLKQAMLEGPDKVFSFTGEGKKDPHEKLNVAPLTPAEIEKIDQWVRQGAKGDLGEPGETFVLDDVDVADQAHFKVACRPVTPGFMIFSIQNAETHEELAVRQAVVGPDPNSAAKPRGLMRWDTDLKLPPKIDIVVTIQYSGEDLGGTVFFAGEENVKLKEIGLIAGEEDVDNDYTVDPNPAKPFGDQKLDVLYTLARDASVDIRVSRKGAPKPLHYFDKVADTPGSKGSANSYTWRFKKDPELIEGYYTIRFHPKSRDPQYPLSDFSIVSHVTPKDKP